MVATLSEAMTVAESMEVSPELFVEMTNSATFRSPLYEMYGKTLTDPPQEIGASMELGEKDIRLFREVAAANGVKTPPRASCLLRDGACGTLDYICNFLGM